LRRRWQAANTEDKAAAAKKRTCMTSFRAMMYVLAAWTGFRTGEVGSLTLRSFRLDDDPPTATLAACFSKRKRQDTQILHPQVVRLLQNWLATKPERKPQRR
jgi:integrase